MKTMTLDFVVTTTALALAAAGFAPAQEQLTPVQESELSEVEQGVGDLGPLSGSLRTLQPDLRQPVGFDAVYRVPGREDLLMRVSGGLYAVFPRSVYAQTRQGEVPMIPYGTTFFIGPPDASRLPGEGDAPAPPPGQIFGDRFQARQPYLGVESVPLDLRVDTYGSGDVPPMPMRSAGAPGLRDPALRDPGSAPGSGHVQAMPTPYLPPRQGGEPVIRKDLPTTIATDAAYRAKRVGELVRQAGEAES